MSDERHIIFKATEEEQKQDCCGDRVSCDVDLRCSCGLLACRHCMQQHILDLHMSKQLELL